MRKYEMVVVTRTDAGHEALRRLYEKITEQMAKSGARHLRFELWGKRRLAYPIGKSLKGVYMYFVFLAEGDFIKELQRTLRLSNIVLRYLNVLLEEGIDPETYDYEKEAQFDSLPSEAEESDRDRPTTGWDAEFAAAGESAGGTDDDDEESDDEDDDGDRRKSRRNEED
jgi:small subunit ribosomal protein S6